MTQIFLFKLNKDVRVLTVDDLITGQTNNEGMKQAMHHIYLLVFICSQTVSAQQY